MLFLIRKFDILIPLKFVLKDPIYNMDTLVQVMTWHRTGDKPLPEPVMTHLQTHMNTWLSKVVSENV